jgi:hypothetical protein
MRCCLPIAISSLSISPTDISATDILIEGEEFVKQENLSIKLECDEWIEMEGEGPFSMGHMWHWITV